MTDSLYNIFGDHIVKQTMKNVSRQPLSNVENMGKTISSGPVKPNEPLKKTDSKKSFLSNKGMALQSTPAKKTFTPCSINVGSLIYSDVGSTVMMSKMDDMFEDIEFTKPTYNYDNYHKDVFDFLLMPEEEVYLESPPSPATPPPSLHPHSIDFNCSYQDEFFTDEFSNESIVVDDLGLPDLY